MSAGQLDRRLFLASSAGTIATSLAASGRADDLPKVTRPRATDGDHRFEPNWDERLTVTVGGEKADLVGSSDRVIQAAIDYVARLGSGTVKILPGVYTLRNSVFLPSRIRLLGSGADSVLTKGPSEKIKLAADSDWYDQEITLEKTGDFRVGDGVLLTAKDPHSGANTVIKRTLVAKSGKRYKINDGLRKNLWLSGTPACASLFPLLTSENTSDVVIENLTIDGNKKNNANLNGNYGGCIFLQDCNRYTMKNVTTRNFNGDGISFQVCHDVVVDGCYSHDNANLGVHPGSGSQRPAIRNCRLHRNQLGLFWCWGVRYGLAEGNKIHGNQSYGISIGHCDTDNVMRRNEILDSGKVGILFRNDSRGADFWANRNLIENNTIVNSGGEDGIAIDIQGNTKDVVIVGNSIRETRAPMNRTALRIAKVAGKVQLKDNKVEGFATEVIDQRE